MRASNNASIVLAACLIGVLDLACTVIVFARFPQTQSGKAGQASASTSKDALSPAVQAPKTAPTDDSAVHASSVSSPSSAVTLPAAQTRAVLDKLFLAESRIQDLLGMLQPAAWKMNDAGHEEIDQTVSSAKTHLQDLENSRYQLYYHLNDVSDGRKVLSVIKSLQPQVASIAATAANYQGVAVQLEFQQAGQDLANAEDQLEPFISTMEARLKALLSPGRNTASGEPGLETEVIRTQPNIKPLSSIVTEPPPLSASQVKALLYKVYVPAYRIKDLLSQEQPEKWKATSTDKNAFAASRRDLLNSLIELERWRSLFSEHPTDQDSGFKTYVSIDRVLEPLEGVTLRVGRYESPRLAANYAHAGGDLRARQSDLLPYLNFLFTHSDEAVQMYQTDLSNCQNQLGFAMHGLRSAAVPMKNVVPQFQGRNVAKREAERMAKVKARASRKRASRQAAHKRHRHHAVHARAASSAQ
jgi:hypothetical protein